MSFDNSDFIIKTNSYGDEVCLCAYVGSERVVTVPDGVTMIRSYAFADKEKPNDTITSIILPDSVKKTEMYAFSFCHALTEIQWPRNEEFVLGSNLFEDCLSLEEITIPKNVSIIETLSLPKNLKRLTVHDDLTVVNQSAFVLGREQGAQADWIHRNVHTIQFLLKNPVYALIDGFMVNTKHKTALFYAERNKKEVRVPDGIETIAALCFEEYDYFERGFDDNAYFKTKCIPVEKITIPTSVKKIRPVAFYHCKNLKTVVYEGKSADLEMGNDIFADCGIYHDARIICSDTAEKKHKTTNLLLERLCIIHHAIKSGKYPNTEDLRRLCSERLSIGKLGTSTISRDIEFLRDRFGAPLEYDYVKKGYHYKPDFSLNFDTLMPISAGK